MQIIFYLVPQGRIPEAFFDNLGQPAPAANPLQTRPVADIVKDALGKRIGLLKDHPDLLAKID